MMDSERPICPGSGKPTRTDGSCDRCARRDACGEYKWTDRTDRDPVFVVFPSFGYYVAVEHAPVPYSAPGKDPTP